MSPRLGLYALEVYFWGFQSPKYSRSYFRVVIICSRILMNLGSSGFTVLISSARSLKDPSKESTSTNRNIFSYSHLRLFERRTPMWRLLCHKSVTSVKVMNHRVTTNLARVQVRFVNDVNSWRTPESLRNPIQARRGRNGRSIPRGGYESAPQNSDQDIAIAIHD